MLIPLLATEVKGRVIMCSGGAAFAAQAGRGSRVPVAEEDYQIILPQLPTGRIAVYTVFFMLT